jgi:hypothetical protein
VLTRNAATLPGVAAFDMAVMTKGLYLRANGLSLLAVITHTVKDED